MSNMLIYKIFREPEWVAFLAKGQTQGAPIDLTDGFIHFSNAEQLAETLAKHFTGEPNLWLIAVQGKQLGNDLRWEPSRGGALFPHLYRMLRLSDVAWARQIVDAKLPDLS